jgi:HAE1 family hydrophobic/amphiphilic exporter-1
MKNIIKFAIEKSTLNYLLLAFIFMLSVFSYIKIPKEIFPISTLNSINITGVYAGASADMLNLMAVDKIEDELSNLSQIDKINSVVKSDFFDIKITLKSSYSVNDVIDEVKDIISKIKSDLPSDMKEPIVSKVKIAFPLITASISGDITTNELLKIAKEIKKDLLKFKDLSTINIWSDSDKELSIVLNENKINAYGLDTAQVVSSISSLSSIFPAGNIKDSTRHYYLSSINGVKDIKSLENSILKINNIQVYLKDIASIEYKLSDIITVSHFNAQTNMSIGINKGKTGDSIELVKQIKKLLNEKQEKYTNLTFDSYMDTSVWIKNRLNTVTSNIIFGILLLSIALLFFVNARIAFVVALGIPTSFMIGIIGAEQLGHSINMLSLLGALLALGMLVDEAIVVGENIYRHMEMGKDNKTAAIDGAYEMFPAVLTATATTIFAFLPILMMSGETGVFLKILPIMISVLILSSMFEAFIFLPLHAKHTFKVNKNKENTSNIWDKLKVIYEKLLHKLLLGKYISLLIFLSFIIFSTIYFAMQSKFEFMPKFDTTQIYISGSVGVGKNINKTENLVLELEKKLLKNFELGDEIDSISSVSGFKLDGKQIPQFQEFYFHIFVNLKESAPKNFFDIYINPLLSPKYDDTDMTRYETARQIASKMRNVLKEEMNSNSFEDITVKVPGAGIVKNDIEIAFFGDNQNDVDKFLYKIKDKLENIEGVKNVAHDILLGNMDLKFAVNSYGLSLGFNESNIINTLKPYYFKAALSKMYDDTGIVDIVFKSQNKDKLSSLNNFELNIPNSNKKVNINDIVDFKQISSLSQIIKEDAVSIKSITASLDKNITSEDVYKILNIDLQNTPLNVHYKIKGEEEENKKVKQEMVQAFVIALILIFISLVVMFNSLLKSFLILSTIPLSILGVLVGHIIMDVNLTMPGIIGIIGLAGVIVNDGIIMMDFIQKSTNIKELNAQAQLRLRPIILTSFTTILGLSSLIFFASGQALILQPMAISLGFGLLWATVLNLYYLPLVYRIIYLRKE